MHAPIGSPFRRLVLVAAALVCAGQAAAIAADSYAAPASSAATGPSWLARMGRSFEKSAFGRIGALGPTLQDPELQAPPPPEGRWLREGFVVRGADLFRYTCRACHGAAGTGSPPEILPLVNAVRNSSVKIQLSRSQTPNEPAETVAALADKLLRHRLKAGGTAMPAFDYMSPEETEVLLGYLAHLAEVPDPRHTDRPLQMPVDRVGEQIVKGTCQICHDAKPGASHPGVGADTKPLAALTDSVSVGDFVRRARHRGAGLSGRGPQATYLRGEELEAAYFYLTAYPPH